MWLEVLLLFLDSRQVVMLLSLIGLLQDEALNGFCGNWTGLWLFGSVALVCFMRVVFDGF